MLIKNYGYADGNGTSRDNMSLETAIKKAYKTAKIKNWDTIYVMIDVHDTIMDSNYKNCRMDFFPEAILALQKISKLPEVYLSLYTCCYELDANVYISRLKELDIDIKSVNTTPIKNTTYGCFDKKPYFSILIDDKAGFDPSEWSYISDYFYKYRDILYSE
jgi:hypothetical protein